MADVLREHLDGHASTTVMNGDNFQTGHVVSCLSGRRRHFQHAEPGAHRPVMPRDAAPPQRGTTGVSSELIQADALQGHGVVISLTDCYRLTDYGEPINALVMHPQPVF